MLKEERDASRARCKPLIGKRIYHISDPEYYIKSCLALLDALEEMEADPILPRDIKINHSIYRKGIPLSTLLLGIENIGKTLDFILADRDNWKARAEAYKSALEAGQCCIACDKRPGCGQILPCERFKLDEERFGKENGGTNA